MGRIVASAIGLLLTLMLPLAVPVIAGGARPDTVFFEDLTFDEIRAAIGGGATNVIIATGGTEDAGAQLVVSAPTDVATYAVDRIARAVGQTLVAPVIAYAPGGLVAVPRETGYEKLIEAAAESVKASGFKNVFLLGDSAASQPVLKTVAERLDTAWKSDGVRVFHVSAYAGPDGGRARAERTSEVMAINAQRVRLDALPAKDAAAPSPQRGLALLTARIDAAAAQIRGFVGQPKAQASSSASSSAPSSAPSPASASSVASSGASASAALRVLPTPDPRSSSSSSSGAPGAFIEDLTAAEIQAAVARGNTVAIVPTGGTEKNGFHMAMGKHNFHVRAGAELMAKKLANALVAPVLQYVPEGRASEATPGVLSCGRDCFEDVVSSIARGVKALGFTEILLVGDNGGNQAGLTAVAALLNKEWQSAGTKVYALTDFYDKGHEYQDAWFLAQFGWDAAVVGSHAGIKDTSQLLYVKPQDVRTERIADSFNNARESSVSGDPTKATAEFGRIAIEFKVNGAIAQYRALKAQAEGGTGAGGGAGGAGGAGGRAGRRGARTTGGSR